ncbi:uncharacterized protein B0H64DRAFT_387762 [Chaetomium fimeti]|uniref:Uncharacterized protein n=1 Tax=Chaetomium fimeti TaxID=1854472 RepID=A0AAE0HMH0_9PEZI|nr:hypothetical protein B0H64DRAFT_387762 [Chaetomium fimeti]
MGAMRTHGIFKYRRTLNQPANGFAPRTLSSLELFLVSWLPLGLRRRSRVVFWDSFDVGGERGGELSQAPSLFFFLFLIFSLFSSQQTAARDGSLQGRNEIGEAGGKQRRRKQSKQADKRVGPIPCRPAVQVGLWPRGRASEPAACRPYRSVHSQRPPKKVIARSPVVPCPP